MIVKYDVVSSSTFNEREISIRLPDGEAQIDEYSFYFHVNDREKSTNGQTSC
jgi:hypothetical protein